MAKKEKSEILDIKSVKKKIENFAQKRDWNQFHSPKNLAMALSVEAAELLEIFQWLKENESYDLKKNKKELLKVKDEIADILTYTIRLSDILGIHIPSELERKMKLNAKKYPVRKAKGRHQKYTDYQ